MKKRLRLNKEECDIVGVQYRGLAADGRPYKHTLKGDQIRKLMEAREVENELEVSNSNKSETRPNDYPDGDHDSGKVLMSSWDYKLGRNMKIEEYCEKYNLPFEHISSWKAVTHTGTPYYNIVFKTVSELLGEELTEEVLANVISGLVKPVMLSEPVMQSARFEPSNIDRAIITDVHIGMDPNGRKKNALYGRDWTEKEIMKTCQQVASGILDNRTGLTLIIDELGDFMDGWDGQTVRKGHDLPQCMTNPEAFRVALQFKIRLVQYLAPYYDTILCNNVCEDNHAGDFGEIVNEAFKGIIELQYPGKVTVFNRTKFMDHYQIADHLFVLTHGKDSQHLKFGFKPILDQKAAEKIDQYLKHHNLYKLGCRIELSKGDSHQALFDMCTSDDFEYFNYPALAPSSDWVQVNFKKGRRGFVMQNLENSGHKKVITPIFLT